MDTEHGDLVPVGQGPVATVLAGLDETTGEGFALKVFPGGIDRHTRSKLDRELRSLAGLPDRGNTLVPDGTAELADGRFAVRMELCAQSLTELLAGFGPLSADDTVALGSALATALADAHQAGLVHGGLAPPNVLFRASGAPVLTDFGLALRQAFPRDAGPGVAFQAPETVRDGISDDRADLYGLGAVLYFALTGRAPHPARPGEPSDAVALRVLSEDVPPLDRPDVPPDLRRLVSALLARDPADRPIDATFAATRLAEPFAEQPLVVRPAGPPIVEYGPDRAKPRKRRIAALLSAVGALGALGVAGAFFLTDPPREMAVPSIPAPVPGTTTAPAAAPIEVILADPVDHTAYVDLSWRSTATRPLDFAVVVAAPGKPQEIHVVQRVTAFRVKVDPAVQYCFTVQGTDGVATVESSPKGIRSAACTR